MVRYASPRSPCSPRVMLLPGVNVYPLFSLFSARSPCFACCCLVRACLRWGCAWVVSSICGVGVPLLVSLLVPCALVPFLALSLLFFLSFWFCSVVVLASSFVVWCVGSVSSLALSLLSLFLFWPRVALPWDCFGPLGNQVLIHPIHMNTTH